MDLPPLPFPNPSLKVIVMLSGGVSSVAALWKVLCMGYSPILVYVDHLHSDSVINQKRLKCVVNILAQARKDDGYPLAVVDKSMVYWKPNIKILNYIPSTSTSEFLFQIAHDVANQYNRRSPPLHVLVVWGSWNSKLLPLSSKLEAQNSPILTHRCFFHSDDHALLSLMVSDLHSHLMPIPKPGIQSSGPYLSQHLLALLCSCDGSTYREASSPSSPNPFSAMCSSCHGCHKWFASWDRLSLYIPYLNHSDSLRLDDLVPSLSSQQPYVAFPSYRQEPPLSSSVSKSSSKRKLPSFPIASSPLHSLKFSEFSSDGVDQDDDLCMDHDEDDYDDPDLDPESPADTSEFDDFDDPDDPSADLPDQVDFDHDHDDDADPDADDLPDDDDD